MIGVQFVNGWELLRRRYGGTLPDSIPFDLVVNAVGTGFDLFTLTTDPVDGEFYILSTSIEGDNHGGGQAGLGTVPTQSPDHLNVTINDFGEDASGVRYLMNKVHARHIFGSGALPYHWPAPLIVPQGAQLRFDLLEEEGTEYTYRLAFHGFKRSASTPPLPLDFFLSPRLLDVFREQRSRLELGRVEPFVYGVSIAGGNIPPFGTEQFSFTVTEGYFVLCDLMGALSDENHQPIQAPPYLVRFSADVGDVRFEDRGVPWDTAFGTGRRPRALHKPLILPAGSTFTILLTDVRSATTFGSSRVDGSMAFSGVRILPDWRR